jgi:type I restriction enzyme S subunit
LSATLGDICSMIVDSEHKTAPKSQTGYPLIRTTDIGRGRIVLDRVHRVDEATYRSWTKRAVPMPGDLILAREAPVGGVGIVLPGMNPCLGQRTVLLRPDRTRVEPLYLNFLLASNPLQDRMAALSNGATVPHLNMADIRRLEIPSLPALEDQRRIASILSAYDELIKNNTRRIEILEEMAQAIYREWFVNFRYPGHEGVPLVESELGPIPKGWTVAPVAAVAATERHAVTGGPFGSKLGRKDYLESGVPVIRGGNLRVGGGFDEEDLIFVSEQKAEELSSSLAKRGDIIVTQRGTLGQVGLIPQRSRFERYVLSQSQMKITVDTERTTPEFVFSQLRTAECTQRFVAQAMSTGVPHVNLSLLREFKILAPEAAIQQLYTANCAPIFDQIWVLAEVNRTVARTRDLLLPRLISGEVDVSDLDIDVGELVS